MVAGERFKSGMRMNSIVRRAVITGKEESYTVTADHPIGVYESVFAPRSPDAPEDDGYLITPVAHFTKKWSEFLIFDTQDISSEERREGKECVSTCRAGWSRDHEKKK